MLKSLILLISFIFILNGCDNQECVRTGVIRYIDDGNCWGCFEKTTFHATDGKIPRIYTIQGIYGAIGDTMSLRLRYLCGE